MRARAWLSDAALLAAIRPGPGVRYHCVPMSPGSDDVTPHNAPVIHHKCISGWSNLVRLSSTSLYLRNLRSGHLASQVQFTVLFTLGINEHSHTRQCLVTTLDIHLIETVVTMSCRCHTPVTWPGVRGEMLSLRVSCRDWAVTRWLVTAGQAPCVPTLHSGLAQAALTPHSEEQATTNLKKGELKGALKLGRVKREV